MKPRTLSVPLAFSLLAGGLSACGSLIPLVEKPTSPIKQSPQIRKNSPPSSPEHKYNPYPDAKYIVVNKTRTSCEVVLSLIS